SPQSEAQPGTTQPTYCHLVLTSPPPSSSKPGATAKPGPSKPPRLVISEEQPVDITAQQCEKAGEVYTLTGNVEIHFADYIFHGDKVTYDHSSGDATSTGHATLDGGPRDMHIASSHGVYNIHTQTGKFYDVNGTTGARFRGLNV